MHDNSDNGIDREEERRRGGEEERRGGDEETRRRRGEEVTNLSCRVDKDEICCMFRLYVCTIDSRTLISLDFLDFLDFRISNF